ncbi:MAG: glycoside hydrolase family 127 protein, partial [Pedobacter sp.]|nr:glycoside hydrolase family 127 protein [Pedobacter sp.]
VWKAATVVIGGAKVVSLEGDARLIEKTDWSNSLYHPISKNTSTTSIKLIPYFAWGNRGHSEMSVWLPLSR